MNLKLKILTKPDYLFVNFTGAGDLEEVSQQFNLLADRCLEAKKTRLLVDISKLQTVPEFSERYRAGERAVVFAHNGIRVALVGRREHVDPKLLGELVARNRGVDGRVFTDPAAAKKWLLEEPES